MTTSTTIPRTSFATAPHLGLSRRTFLGTSIAISAAATTGCTGGFSAPQDSSGDRADEELGSVPGTADNGWTPVAPLALTAASELSQDYFLFRNHQIDPTKDTVVAYSRADGEVEAMLLQDGAIKQIYRDPTQPGGWNVYQLPSAMSGVTEMVAGISDPLKNGARVGSPTLKVFYRTSQHPDVVNVAVHDPGDKPSFTVSTVPWHAKSEQLQLSVNADYSLLVAGMVPASSKSATDARLYFWMDGEYLWQGQPQYGFLNGFNYLVDPQFNGLLKPLGFSFRWAAIVAQPNANAQLPQFTLFLPAYTTDATSASVRIWTAVLTGAQGQGSPVKDWIRPGFSAPPNLPNDQLPFAVELLTVLGDRFEPTAVLRTLRGDGKSQGLGVLTRQDNTNKWFWTQLDLPDEATRAPMTLSTALSPPPAGTKSVSSFLDLFVVSNKLLSVIRQSPQTGGLDDGLQPAYTPSIPLQPDVALMTSQAGRSTGNELLLVGPDGGLQTLIKDPVTGHWTDQPVQLPSSELEEVATYRVTLSVIDYWQNPVPNATLQVKASTPTTALVDGATVSLDATGVAVATDAQGQAVLALVADGLSAPTLTVNGSGLPATTVNPSGPVNTYLRGDTTLNGLPPLTATTLSNAKTDDGRSVAPGASDPAAAQDAVTTMSTAATQAVAANVGTAHARYGAQRATTLQRRDGRIGARLPGGGKVTATGALQDINVWSHDALHAIKKGAVLVKKVEYDAKTKLFTLTSDFVGWAGQAVTIIVQGIEDAAHVIHAIINKLGGYIKDAINWIRVEVIGTLKDAVALAAQYDGWLSECCTFLGEQAKGDATKADTWLAAKQATVKASLTKLANSYAPGTGLTDMAANPPKAAGTTHRPAPKGASAADDDGDNPHGNWFLSKVRRELIGGLKRPDEPNIEDMMAKMLTDSGQPLTELKTAFDGFVSFILTAITKPEQAAHLGVSKLLLAVCDLIDAVFLFVRAAVATLFDVLAAMANAIPGLLFTPLSDLPIIGALLSLVGLGKVTIGNLITIIFAFPAVVAYKINHGGKGRPFAPAAGTRAGARTGDANSDLQHCAGYALATWASLDAISYAKTVTKVDPGGFFTAVDIAGPIIVGFLTVPSTRGGEPYFTPPVSGDEADQFNFVSWLCGILPAGLEAAILYLEHSGKNDPDLPAQKSMVNFGVCASGVFALATGCLATSDAAVPDGEEYAVVVLNSIADIIAPLLDDRIAEGTEFISVAVACILTAVCGDLGAALYGWNG